MDLIREMTSVKETSSVEISVKFCGGYKVDMRSSEETRSADDKGESLSRFSMVGSDKRPEELRDKTSREMRPCKRVERRRIVCAWMEGKG